VNRNLDCSASEEYLKLVAGNYWVEEVTTIVVIAVAVTLIHSDIRPHLTDIELGLTRNSGPGAFGNLERELKGKPIIA
jgi:hypothetical protein